MGRVGSCIQSFSKAWSLKSACLLCFSLMRWWKK
jgi:hypothetical protein